MLRNEELAREKAAAVLELLRSRDMAKARTRWLKEALDRSMKVQIKSAGDGDSDGGAGGGGAADAEVLYLYHSV